MKATTLNKIERDDEVNQLENLHFSSLEALWQKLQLLSRLTNLPLDEREKLSIGCLLDFTAATAFEMGLEKDEVLRIIGESYDDAASVEEEDASSLPPIAIVPNEEKEGEK